jgi:hypothetical protein
MKLFEEIFKKSKLEKVTGRLGSNPGGIYKIDNSEYYIKFPNDEDSAKIEVLAAKIYQLLHIKTPEIFLIEHENKLGIASKMIDVLECDSFTDYLEELSNSDEIKSNFVIDAWLANWDVAGFDFGSRNILLDKEHNPIRIDQGGALSRRAQGARKGSAFGNDVIEVDTFRNPNIANEFTFKLFKNINNEDITRGMLKLINLDIPKLKELIDEYAPDDEKESLFTILLKRRDYLINKYGNNN